MHGKQSSAAGHKKGKEYSFTATFPWEEMSGTAIPAAEIVWPYDLGASERQVTPDQIKYVRKVTGHQSEILPFIGWVSRLRAPNGGKFRDRLVVVTDYRLLIIKEEIHLGSKVLSVSRNSHLFELQSVGNDFYASARNIVQMAFQDSTLRMYTSRPMELIRALRSRVHNGTYQFPPELLPDFKLYSSNDRKLMKSLLDLQLLAPEDELLELSASAGAVGVFKSTCNLLERPWLPIISGVQEHLSFQLDEVEAAVLSKRDVNAAASFDFNDAFTEDDAGQRQGLQEEHVIAVAAILKYSLWFDSLHASSLKLGDNGAMALFGAMQYNALLTRIALKSVGLTQKGIPDRLNPNITHLSLAFNDIGPKGALNLANAFKSIDGLQELDLEGCRLLVPAIDAILKGVSIEGGARGRVATIAKLNLSGNPLGKAGSEHLAAFLASGSAIELQSLVLAQCGLEADQIFQALLDNEQLLDGLQLLDVSHNALNDASARLVCDFIGRSKSLEKLGLVKTKLNKQRLQSLLSVTAGGASSTATTGAPGSGAQAGRGGRRSEASSSGFCLDLSLNPFNKDCCKAIADAINNGTIPHFQQLMLRGCSLGMDGMVTVVEAMSRCGMPSLHVLALSTNVTPASSLLRGKQKERLQNALVQLLSGGPDVVAAAQAEAAGVGAGVGADMGVGVGGQNDEMARMQRQQLELQQRQYQSDPRLSLAADMMAVPLTHFYLTGDEKNHLKSMLLPVLEALRFNRTLLVLDVTGNKCSKIGSALSGLLRDNTALQHLAWDDNLTSVESFEEVSKGMQQNATMLNLALPSRDVTRLHKSRISKTDHARLVEALTTIQSNTLRNLQAYKQQQQQQQGGGQLGSSLTTGMGGAAAGAGAPGGGSRSSGAGGGGGGGGGGGKRAVNKQHLDRLIRKSMQPIVLTYGKRQTVIGGHGSSGGDGSNSGGGGRGRKMSAFVEEEELPEEEGGEAGSSSSSSGAQDEDDWVIPRNSRSRSIAPPAGKMPPPPPKPSVPSQLGRGAEAGGRGGGGGVLVPPPVPAHLLQGSAAAGGKKKVGRRASFLTPGTGQIFEDDDDGPSSHGHGPPVGGVQMPMPMPGMGMPLQERRRAQSAWRDDPKLQQLLAPTHHAPPGMPLPHMPPEPGIALPPNPYAHAKPSYTPESRYGTAGAAGAGTTAAAAAATAAGGGYRPAGAVALPVGAMVGSARQGLHHPAPHQHQHQHSFSRAGARPGAGAPVYGNFPPGKGPTNQRPLRPPPIPPHLRPVGYTPAGNSAHLDFIPPNRGNRGISVAHGLMHGISSRTGGHVVDSDSEDELQPAPKPAERKKKKSVFFANKPVNKHPSRTKVDV